jgi:hypothetical protein
MEITFTTWIVCYPPTIKNMKLETIDQFLGRVSKILFGSFKSVGIAKIRLYICFVPFQVNIFFIITLCFARLARLIVYFERSHQWSFYMVSLSLI